MAEYDPTAPATYDESGDDGYQDGEYSFDQPEVEEEEEDDDYDPSSFAFDDSAGDAQAVQASSAPVAHTEPPPKPKTVGGFVVSDDEEDEEEQQQEQKMATDPPPPSQVNGTEGAHSGLGAVAVSEAQDVSVASEAPQDTAAVDLNASMPDVVVPAPASASAPVSNPDLTASFVSAPAPASSLENPDQGKQYANASTAASATATPQPPAATSQPNGTAPVTPTSARLPHDKVGQLEDRIKEDPKADTDAWRTLIAHYREKGQLDHARKVYERFFEVFPSAATMWIDEIQMELEQDDRRRAEELFYKCLLQTPNVDLWTVYLNYLRRVHPTINDPDGSKRNIISQAFETLLEHVGIDPDAGALWREYIDFIRTGPGVIGGQGWQDMQKVDLLRKAYQRAIKLPNDELTKLWKEYDNFEQGLSKATARKYMQEQSPHYMTSRTANHQLEGRIDGLDRKSLPKLPPLHGYAGEDEFATQVEKWRSWIEWEKEDPLVFKEDEVATYRKRVVYVYKQATMQLRFYPEIWFEAASWCYDQGTEEMSTQGEEFLDAGIVACPESVLLALKKADRVESNLEAGNSDEVAIRNGEKLDGPFEGVLQALYALHKKVQERMNKSVVEIQEYYASLPPEEEDENEPQIDGDDEDEAIERPQTRADQMKAQIAALRTTSSARHEILKSTISYIWVAKLRAFRRIQGQGQPGKAKKGFRGVFAEARPRGQLTSAVYIANALMEWNCYRDASAAKIFERGLRLFPTDEVFALEYMRWLIDKNDDTNARGVFETFLTRITAPPKEKGKGELSPEVQRQKCRPLMEYMHHFESHYGDLEKVHKLERRMKEMFPDEPEVLRFGNRFALPSFDAMQVQLVISPTQAQPRAVMNYAQQPPILSIEQPGMRSPPQADNIRLGPNGPYIASPKRPLEDSDTDTPQRKFIRGESPLKGAAGRRIQHTATNSTSLPVPPMPVGNPAAGGAPGFMTKTYTPGVGAAPMPPVPAGPPALPRDVTYLLSIIPHAGAYRSTHFDPGKMVELLRGVRLEGVRV